MFDRIRGIVAFKAVGADGEAFINTIKDSDVMARCMKSVADGITGEVYRGQYGDLVAIAKKHRMTVSVIGKKGLIFTVIRYKKRYGIVLGGILAFAMVMLLSNTVLSIEIEGNKTISEEQVLALLEENGISYGRFIPSLDLPEVQRSMASSMNKFAWVGIRNSGGKLVVEIDEVVRKPQRISFHSPCNIVASRPAQVVGAEVFGGILSVKIGDGVTRGQMLISGAFTDMHGKSAALHAYGKVIGQYTDEIQLTQSLSEEKNLPTGEKILRDKLMFFGLEIPLGIAKDISGEYDFSQSTTYFSLFSLKLPIGIKHQTYSPFSLQTESYAKEEAEALLLQKITDYEKNLHESDRIVSKEILRADSETAVSAKISYLFEGEIGVEQEILVKN